MSLVTQGRIATERPALPIFFAMAASITSPDGVSTLPLSSTASSSSTRPIRFESSETSSRWTRRYGVSMKPNSFRRAYVASEPIRPMFGAFWRLNRADAPVVAVVNVADVEPGAVA